MANAAITSDDADPSTHGRTDIACMRAPGDAAGRVGNLRVALLTNFIPPHHLPVLQALDQQVGQLAVLLSTAMEKNRSWRPEWGALDVRLQRTLTLRRPWKHESGFTEANEIHFPLDTIGQLRRFKPDVIVTEQFGARSLLSALYRRRFPATPLVIWATLSEHTEKGRGRLRGSIRRWLCRQADALAVNGPSAARYVMALGVAPDAIVETPYTAVPGIFDRQPLRRDPQAAHRLLYSGQFVERKGLVPFLEGLIRWAKRNPHRIVEFDLVGYGPLRQSLEQMPLPENLRLHFLGERGFDQLPGMYAKAGIFVLPTLADEWGMVVNEALAAGLPVLGSRYSQAVEVLVKEGETGWSFTPGEEHELDRAIDRAMNSSPERLHEMRIAARRGVAHLTPQFAADRTVEAIELAIFRAARRQR